VEGALACEGASVVGRTYSHQIAVTSTYCKNFDVLFATLWTKLAILLKNRGNFNNFFFILSDNVAIAMLTSLLPRYRLSCHAYHIVISLATFVT
jgi:hypothetical protein